MTYKMLKLSKVVDKQIWDFEHPLRQCEGLTFEVLQKLEAKRLNVDRLRDMGAKEIGEVILIALTFIDLNLYGPLLTFIHLDLYSPLLTSY